MQVNMYETACLLRQATESGYLVPQAVPAIAIQLEINMMQWESPMAKQAGGTSYHPEANT